MLQTLLFQIQRHVTAWTLGRSCTYVVSHSADNTSLDIPIMAIPLIHDSAVLWWIVVRIDIMEWRAELATRNIAIGIRPCGNGSKSSRGSIIEELLCELESVGVKIVSCD